MWVTFLPPLSGVFRWMTFLLSFSVKMFVAKRNTMLLRNGRQSVSVSGSENFRIRKISDGQSSGKWFAIRLPSSSPIKAYPEPTIRVSFPLF